jgi:hypothetical protein
MPAIDHDGSASNKPTFITDARMMLTTTVLPSLRPRLVPMMVLYY